MKRHITTTTAPHAKPDQDTQGFEKLLQSLKEKWPSSVVARTEVKPFSGGALNTGTMANMDSLGLGPDGAFKIGRKKVYPVDSLIKWMAQRASE